VAVVGPVRFPAQDYRSDTRAAMIKRHVLNLASTQRLVVMPIFEQHDTSGREARLARLLAWMTETAKRG